MNTLSFYSCINAYEKFAESALLDIPKYYGLLECRTCEVVFKILLSIPVYLVRGVLSLVGRVVSLCTTDFEDISVQYEPIFAYSDLGVEALLFARQELRKQRPSIPQLRPPTSLRTPWYESIAFKQPANAEITRLAVLYAEYKKDFFRALENNPQDSWSNSEVIRAADVCMKVAFAISALTLDDIQSFNDRLVLSGSVARMPGDTLVCQDSYQFKTFYDCTQMYHWIRGGIFSNGQGLVCSPDLSAPHLLLFYEKGTAQNTWNALYNEYCDRVRLYVSEEDLTQKDPRHVNWTQKDTDSTAFIFTPDSIPT